MNVIINLCGELLEVDESFFEKILICEEKEVGDSFFVTFLSGVEKGRSHFSIYKENYLSLKREMKINKLL